MSSTSDSTKASKIVDVPYVRPLGLGRNPFEIASVSNLLWKIGLPLAAEGPQPVNNPRHELTFGYLGPANVVTAHRRTKIETTIREWERYAHVSFVYRDDIKEANIRISFKAEGNWSLVGSQHEAYLGGDEDDGETMNLMDIGPNGAVATNYERHVILHEFGHSLGLLHEHQSPAREGVITLNAGRHYNINSSTCCAFSNS